MTGYRRNHTFADLMSRVEKTASGCWQWTGSLCYGGDRSGGYGKASVQGQRDYVHRLSYREFKGEIPEGLVIDHLCRNRGCVNPDHLEAVTNAVNLRRGSHSKLTQEQVIEIRQELSEPIDRLCSKFGVHYQTLAAAAVGVSWGEVS